MSSVQERLQLKRVPLDTWNVREQLCLASAVVRSGDQNWMSVSRALKTVGEPNRPPDWYSQKSCAAQYGALLEHVDTPKRKKRNSEGGVETPQESILKQLTQQRILEIQGTLSEMNNQYEQLKNEIAEVRSQTTTDDRIQELWSGIEAAKRARERECARRAAWLKDREERRARAERTWRPAQTPPPTTPTTAPPSSPLLTSLLKSSPVVTTPQHIPHPATVVDSVSPSAGAPTLSLLLEQAQDSKNAAIEHIKSQLVQIEHQLKASTQATVVPQPVIQPAPAVDIDDIEIKAEDVYAFRDIDINIPPVTALHKGNVRVAEKPVPKKEIEAPASEPEVVEPPVVEVKEEPVPETTIAEDMTPNEVETVEEEKSPQIEEEKEPEPKEAEVKISFPEVKFPTLEIKVIQLDEQKDSQIKEEVREPEPVPEPPAPEERTEIMEEDKEETRTPEEKIADEPEAVEELAAAPVAEEAVEPPPAEPQPEEEIITDPQNIPLPPEMESKDEEKEVPEINQTSEPEPEEPAKVTADVVEEKEKREEEPVPVETEKKEEVPEESVEEKLIEDIKKEDDAEDSIPLKEMIKEELPQEEVKREGIEEDTHTETDDDTPMELSREEEKDGKKKRDYSRKKKSDSRTCSGSESAPESPSASDAERQHRLWKKSVMLVYSRLCAHKYASLFLRPISDEEAPGYSVVVKRPMDLSTVRRNIDAGNVRTTAEFQRDVLLMLSNALLYNSSSHSVYAMAREMHEDAQCQLGMLLAAQAHAGLCAPPRRKRRLDAHAHAHGKHHRA